MNSPRGNLMIFKMYWLILILMPLTWANGSDLKGAPVMTTVAPTPGHRNAHQQLRLQQLQEAQLLEAHQQQHHHHLRHEQHLRAELEGNRQPPIENFEVAGSGSKKAFFDDPQLPMQQHHLRHHNRHHLSWEQRVFPSLRHQQHRLAIGTSTARNIMTTDAPTTTYHGLISNHSRYFDRDGIFPAWAEPRSTRGPNWRQEVDTSDSDEDSDEDDDDDDYEYDEDADSNGVDEELARQMPRYSLFTQKLPHIDMKEPDYNAYDQSDELDIVSNNNNHNNNKHPSVANPHDKSAGKRNIFDWLFKQNREKEVVKKPHTTTTSTTTTSTTTTVKPVIRTERPKLQLIDANLKNHGGEEEDSNEDSDSESEEGFSNEQWNKIEHEHHLKQQKHQKELLAMREKSRNTPLIRNIENEDVENIYARNYIAGKVTPKKEEQLGSPEAAIRARRLHAQKQKSERALAHAHMNQVLKEATCRIPQKRCQLVQQDPSKIYTPHCTILHRCSEDSGCCPSRSQICAAKSTHNVELHFFVKSTKHRSVIEKRTFVNHTECHCIERSTYNEDTAMANYGQSVVRATILSCTCPKSFEKILQDDGQCRCDCSSGNYDCDWLKRGNEHFAMNDRKSIQQGRCKPPTCEFGPYMDKHGRCPKQHEQPAYNAMS
ncbi:uncharacterized protein Pvf3 isoform X1 [Drosophila takahashii]|uniref:uncharacterized protein Pvf3 isoform X1 n=1 Tax=Drosophila takahashii TaxID=29030 RepID=UPI001CF8738B|nr:uncharacterized protein LOC108062453 isoform X1 [Drosophila takahashii]XP_017004634.2 uncharacterized protein LOC108062453 isoform X1 [Drosophila takahashii]